MSREGGSLFVLSQAERFESARRCKLRLTRGSRRLAHHLGAGVNKHERRPADTGVDVFEGEPLRAGVLVI
jgi:hypothetical protein